jgi:hypothetical protein
MLEVGKKVSSSGNILAFRPTGEKARRIIEEVMNQGKDNCTYLLDFKNIDLSDTSFLDETIVELTYHCQGHRYGDRLIAFKNLLPILNENLHSAILLRDDKKKQYVPVVDLSNNQLRIVPSEDESLMNSLEASLKNLLVMIFNSTSKRITAVELAEKEQIQINTAATRLKRLYDYGFLHRQNELVGNGKHFVYFSIGQ